MKKIVLAFFLLHLITAPAFGQNPLKIKYSESTLDSAYSALTKSVEEEKGGDNNSAEYKVGVDDVLDISVIKPQAFASIVTVAPDGAITFPYIGNVMVKDLTLPQIQEEVQKRLADGYMEYPVISVTLRESRSKRFTIYGQVIRPGTYPVEENLTLLRAVTKAGGFIVPGSTGKIKLLRPKGDKSEFLAVESDISSILSGDDQDVTVLPGDTVVVSVDKFFVFGQVNRPGAYPVEEKMTLLHAITAASGFIEGGATGKVKVLRPKPEGGNETIESNITAILNGTGNNITIRAGDTIDVTVDKFFIHGDVARPGMYPLEKNTTALKAVSIAGGFIDAGSSGQVKVLRPKITGGELMAITSDIPSGAKEQREDITILPGDTIVVTADKFYVSGQVARPGAYPVKEHMSILHAITSAGGFIESSATGKVKLLRPKGKENKFETIESDIAAVLGGANQDVIVQPGDTIIVSEDNFYVYGEVARPGSYPLEDNTTVLTALSMAGGFTKFGSANRVKILRMGEESSMYDTIDVNIKEVLSGFSDSNTILKPGDIVVISEGVF